MISELYICDSIEKSISCKGSVVWLTLTLVQLFGGTGVNFWKTETGVCGEEEAFSGVKRRKRTWKRVKRVSFEAQNIC